MRKENNHIDLPTWLDQCIERRKGRDSPIVRQAATLAQVTGQHEATSLGESCFHQGLVMADSLIDLGLDDESLAAGLLFPVVHYAQVSLDDIEEQFGTGVRKLIQGTEQMDAIHISHGRLMQSALLTSSIDNLRKMLLAMVDDVRVVLIKLVERLAVLRHIAILGDRERRRIAQETMDIYAPLANRLGVGQLKWRLEDYAFRYLEPERYEEISNALEMHRDERKQFIQALQLELENALAEEGVNEYDISGRVKHNYSIARKMHRKNVPIEEIYDIIALRVLVPTIEDCYKVLSIVHAKWHHIPKEFDDYINNPKPNGYRSIHTAITGPQGRNAEIQIRTFEMHQESELGVAAHWMYKEGKKKTKAGYEAKIAWLRNLIEWQKEIAESPEQEKEAYTHIFDDRVYVFTPNGDVLDFPKGSTPLDFAYTIHTSIGHRCRGAKVNDVMVPLNYQLKMGDKVEVLTAKEAHPSRDWLIAARGYLMTSRAKAKVHHWFRVQDYEQDVQSGAEIFEKESRRGKEKIVLTQAILDKLHFNSKDDLYAAIGRGEAHVGTVINAVLAERQGEATSTQTPSPSEKKRPVKKSMLVSPVEIAGATNLLTHLARCCRPVPGDPIIGYVTLGHGVSIHRQDCENLSDESTINPDRLIEVGWGEEAEKHYTVDLSILANNTSAVLDNLTALLSHDKVPLLSLSTHLDKQEQSLLIYATLEITPLAPLPKVLSRIGQIEDIVEVKRR